MLKKSTLCSESTQVVEEHSQQAQSSYVKNNRRQEEKQHGSTALKVRDSQQEEELGNEVFDYSLDSVSGHSLYK